MIISSRYPFLEEDIVTSLRTKPYFVCDLWSVDDRFYGQLIKFNNKYYVSDLDKKYSFWI
jgi:hypothetical protein